MEVSRVKSMMSSLQSCMEIAKYLDDSPQHMIPAPSGASNATVSDIKDKHRLWRKHVAHMLNAIAFEIAIKVIWELDHRKDCRFAHNISDLFQELTEKSRGDLEAIYDMKSASLARLQGNYTKGRRIRLGDLVSFQSFRDALAANEETMKNFKYEGNFDGKSSAMGSLIWGEDLLYTLPPSKQERIPEALYNYVKVRVNKTSLG